MRYYRKFIPLFRNALGELRESLELLDLSGNCLNAVPANVLRGQNKLMYLDLSDNNILDLPNMQFMNLPLLKEVPFLTFIVCSSVSAVVV